jgi:hypothetical protein
VVLGLEQEVHLAQDDHERVVDLVRDTARQLADRGQPLGPHHVGVGAPQLLELQARLGVQARVVEGQPDLVGARLEQRDLLVAEAVLGLPAERGARIGDAPGSGTQRNPRMPSALTAARAAGGRSLARPASSTRRTRPEAATRPMRPWPIGSISLTSRRRSEEPRSPRSRSILPSEETRWRLAISWPVTWVRAPSDFWMTSLRSSERLTASVTVRRICR